MPAEDNRSGAQASLGKPPADHYSLDTLAKELASESVSHRQALRMIGSALLLGPSRMDRWTTAPTDRWTMAPKDR